MFTEDLIDEFSGSVVDFDRAFPITMSNIGLVNFPVNVFCWLG